MKRMLTIAALIGLFMATGLDLQAHHRRNGPPRIVRHRTTILSPLQLRGHHDRYLRYDRHEARLIAREIRRNEKRIWKLERRIERLYHRRGHSWEIRELEREIYQLERRNDYLRRRLY